MDLIAVSIQKTKTTIGKLQNIVISQGPFFKKKEGTYERKGTNLKENYI